jgi:hypothetical protein
MASEIASAKPAGRLERVLLLVWAPCAVAYVCVYYHTLLRSMAVHFLRLPEKAPSVWRWLDHIL